MLFPLRPARPLAACGFTVGLLACGGLEQIPERLSLEGTLDRDSVSSAQSAPVPVAYSSEGARGEWWPCDVRMTAPGCVDDFHVNVYVALPGVTSLSGVGGGACVSGGFAEGVYELIQRRGGRGDYAIGQDVSAFVLIASDKDDVPGADFTSDAETLAATRLVSGTFRVERLVATDALGASLRAMTAEGRELEVQFQGPMRSGSVVPLDPPRTCVAGALVEP